MDSDSYQIGHGPKYDLIMVNREWLEELRECLFDIFQTMGERANDAIDDEEAEERMDNLSDELRELLRIPGPQ